NSTNVTEKEQSDDDPVQAPSKQTDAEFARILAYHLLHEQQQSTPTNVTASSALNSSEEQSSGNAPSVASVNKATISDEKMIPTIGPDANMTTYGAPLSWSNNTVTPRTYLFNYKDYCLPSDEKRSGYPIRGLRFPFPADVKHILSTRINSILDDYRHYKVNNESDVNSTSSSSSSAFSSHDTPVSIKAIRKKSILSDVPKDKKLMKVRRKSL
uniref:Uncharacterized protein n=1 Tax=Romanomermis culicivorax TaxID=13658 RepID=A0A915I0F2_ROMCU